MSSIDLTSILGNLAQSLLSVETLAFKFGRLIGASFIITGFIKLTKISKYSHEKISTPLAYIFGGLILVALSDSFRIAANTFFGTNNILSYAAYRAFSLYDSMGILIQTAGLIWFVRGCVLMVQASEPGKQKGSKGLFFVLAGVLAMNFSLTVGAANTLFANFLSTAGKLF